MEWQTHEAHCGNEYVFCCLGTGISGGLILSKSSPDVRFKGMKLLLSLENHTIPDGQKF